MRPAPGERVGGKYLVVRLLGDGGMGSVWEARHELLGTRVALKFLHDELARRASLAERFLQEARVSAAIQSPHVIRVTDVDQAPDGVPYLVMEYLEGESLHDLLQREGPLPVARAVDFGLQILAGLEAAHALGIVHRDLKPDNVFVTRAPGIRAAEDDARGGSGAELLKLLDFGIAKLKSSSEYQGAVTSPGTMMGTPEYMAPEQLFAAESVDHRADLYALGVILYECLAGRPPVPGDEPQVIVATVAAGRVPPLQSLNPAVPDALAGAIHRAMAPTHTDRPESAAALRSLLAPFAHAPGSMAYPAAQGSALPAGAPTPRLDGPLTPPLGGAPHAAPAAAAPSAPPAAGAPVPAVPATLSTERIPAAPHSEAPTLGSLPDGTLPGAHPGPRPALPATWPPGPAPTEKLAAVPRGGAGAPSPAGAPLAPQYGAPAPQPAMLVFPAATSPAPAAGRVWPWVVAGVVLLAVGGAAVAVWWLQPGPGTPPPLPLPPVATTATAPPLEQAPLPVVTPPARPARPASRGFAAPRDGGATDDEDAAAPPAYTLPIPTVLPSGFPTLPGFPFPAPPPASTP